MLQFNFLFDGFQIKYKLYGVIVGTIFTVVWGLAGDKVGKNCGKGENKVNYAWAARFVVCDSIEFEEKIKSVSLNNS